MRFLGNPWAEMSWRWAAKVESWASSVCKAKSWRQQTAAKKNASKQYMAAKLAPERTETKAQ